MKKTKATKAVVKKETTTFQKEQISIEKMITQAIQSGVPVETMERILAMRKELKAEYAKEQFDIAMANFQKNCPVITKTKIVLGKDKRTVRYRYAPLDSIIKQVKGIIAENNLSYSIRTTSNEKMLTATVRVSHTAGHSEESSFSIPISDEQYMTEVQKYGARATFAKRYAFTDAFGILTGDEDTDANEEKKEVAKISESDKNKVLAKLDKCMTLSILKKNWDSLEDKFKRNKEIREKVLEIKSLIKENENNK